MKIDFRIIEKAIRDEMRARKIEVYEECGDWFFEAWVDDEDDPGPDPVSITRIAERVTAELENAK